MSDFNRLGPAKDWSRMNEEEKYHEWSWYAECHGKGYMPFEVWAARWDKTYGVV
jgi:hypothetical protein